MEQKYSWEDFQVLKELGVGSFGKVELARNTNTGKLYAIKSVAIGNMDDKAKNDALNQVRLLASIKTTYVIGFQGVFFRKEKKYLCLILEYAEEGDLQSKIAQKKKGQTSEGLEEEFIWKVAYDLLSGLQVLHKHKIIHRDIKTANIFLAEGVAKLGDLNVSKFAEQGMCSTHTGTPYYTAPEIWQGDNYCSKCDIWSMGVVLYELCTLKVPFPGSDFPSLYRRITAGIYADVPSAYSRELRTLISYCLTVDQQSRPAANELLQMSKFAEISVTEKYTKQLQTVDMMSTIKCPESLDELVSVLPKQKKQSDRKNEKKKVDFRPQVLQQEKPFLRAKKMSSYKHIIPQSEQHKMRQKQMEGLPALQGQDTCEQIDNFRKVQRPLAFSGRKVLLANEVENPPRSSFVQKYPERKPALILQKNSMEANDYTIVPLETQEQTKKVREYMQRNSPHKTSYCRFYLRGICIMKPHYCKFAHGWHELDLIAANIQNQMEEDSTLNEKQRRKKYFRDKVDFQQKALFILKNVQYHVLYNYQHSERMQKAKQQIHSLQQLKTNNLLRTRIREVMHRDNWDQFIAYLQHSYPTAQFSVSFLSSWFSKLGFQKPQTRCRFSDFIRYMVYVKGYRDIYILMPPRLTKTNFYLREHCQPHLRTYLHKNLPEIVQTVQQDRVIQQKLLEEEYKELPEELQKKYMCRYYITGNCLKTSQQCKYAHSIESLRYEYGQKFDRCYRQKAKTKADRSMFLSLYHYYKENKDRLFLPDPQPHVDKLCEYPYLYWERWKPQMASQNMQSAKEGVQQDKQQRSESTIMKECPKEDLQKSENPSSPPGQAEKIFQNSEFRSQIRKKMHCELYRKFILLVMRQSGIKHLPLATLQRQYINAGFNHTDQNKFGQLESILWQMGFCTEQVKTKNKKVSYIFQLPSIQQLDCTYKTILREAIEAELANCDKDTKILESALKRSLYANSKPFSVALHHYLRLKGCSFESIIEEHFPQHNGKFIFESSEQNNRLLKEEVIKYFRKNKQKWYRLDSIEQAVKEQAKESINWNHFINYSNQFKISIITSGYRLYFWPFGNHTLIIDQSTLEQKCKININNINTPQQNNNTILPDICYQRIVLVDSLDQVNYAKQLLPHCQVYGVDLEGKLKLNGYIDLIQFSFYHPKSKQIQILIFDLFLMKKNQAIEYLQALSLLRSVLEDPTKVKIMHDCKQDALAIKLYIGADIQNVFDTSGYDIYYQQRCIYNQNKNLAADKLLRLIHQAKVPSLNSVLDAWKAPNGVNILKDTMKKRFGKDRAYFQRRPIDPQFLEYSAQDVEDLIPVYFQMLKTDSHVIGPVIGMMYANQYKDKLNQQDEQKEEDELKQQDEDKEKGQFKKQIAKLKESKQHLKQKDNTSNSEEPFRGEQKTKTTDDVGQHEKVIEDDRSKQEVE